MQLLISSSQRLLRIVSGAGRMALHTDRTVMEQISAMRIDYKVEKVKEASLPSDNPFDWFKIWINEAEKLVSIKNPFSMCLSVVSRTGRPSNRMVHLKSYGDREFSFLTHCKSLAGKILEENPHAALLFYWEPLHRQVRINGPVFKLPQQENSAEFDLIPGTAQLSAEINGQSSAILQADVMEERMLRVGELCKEASVAMPDDRDEYFLKPETFEFWVGGSGRLHDRIRFRRCDPSKDQIDGNLTKQGFHDWIYERLSP